MKIFRSRRFATIILANVVSLIFLVLIFSTGKTWELLLSFLLFMAACYALWYKIWPANPDLEKNILKLGDIEEDGQA